MNDCYIALDATNVNPLKVLAILNNIHDNTKITMEQQNPYVPFLDIIINKDPETNSIWMDIFYQKTGTPRCVPFNSCQTQTMQKRITFALVRQICTLVENREVRKKTFGRISRSFIFLKISQKFNSRSNSKSNKYLY